MKNRNHWVVIYWQNATLPCDLFLCCSNLVIKERNTSFSNNHLIALYKMMPDTENSNKGHETFLFLENSLKKKSYLTISMHSFISLFSYFEMYNQSANNEFLKIFLLVTVLTFYYPLSLHIFYLIKSTTVIPLFMYRLQNTFRQNNF